MGCYIYTGIETAPAAFWGKNYLDLVWGKAVVTNTVITVVAYCCSLQIHITESARPIAGQPIPNGSGQIRSTNPKTVPAKSGQIDPKSYWPIRSNQPQTVPAGQANQSQTVPANQITYYQTVPIRSNQSQTVPANQVKSIPNRTGKSD